jgi:hypothetical protein
MPVLNRLLEICKAEAFEPVAPSWCIVHYLLLKHEGTSNIQLGAIVAASAECSLFSYDPKSNTPMYFNTIGADKRLVLVSGYAIHGIRTDQAEEAFQFIKKGIDAGKGISVAGPEMGLCYGYEDGQRPDERKIYGIADWGPGFNGEYSWEEFTGYVKIFGNNEGFSYVDYEGAPSAKEEILEMLAESAIDWQENHPAIHFGQKKEYYGLKAFRRLIADVSNPETRKLIDSAYINCHAILFQADGRYWLGTYLKHLAEQFQDESREIVNQIGELYIQVYERLKLYMEYDILENKDEEEIAVAIAGLKEAYEAEKAISGHFSKVRALI